MFMVALAMLTGLNACVVVQKNVSTTAPDTKVVKEGAKPVKMILDSDFGSSTDDLFALMMLHHYIDEGRVDLKGIIVDREGEKNAGIVDIFNNYYGHPNIPVGLERNGVKNPRCFIPYNGICDLKDAKGAPLFKRTLNTATLPDGYKLYRQLLSKAEDKSIVVVAIGFATTLAQLFESQADEYSSLGGAELFGQKVKAVYIQSGRFEAGDSLCGYNMRAASRQSAIFYDKLPKNVDLIMSPSNIGDGMDYLPADVLADLSYTELNPIKAVSTHYTCDTGQRMWDTNCLVNAVLGDNEYHLSPRGWVTFIDRGEESQMLFTEDPGGNARYQRPGDSYFNQLKLMDIRRHNRITPNPSAYTIESPQPQIIGKDAAAWVKPRTQLLIDKYLGSAGNTLDPDNVRQLFRPLGYTGPNAADYREAEQMLVDTLYTIMLRRAVDAGKKSLVVVSGPAASGKSTAARQMKLGHAGLVYDATLTAPGQIERVIAQAKAEGISDITLMLVNNDLLTCYNNAFNRGKQTWRFYGTDYIVSTFRDCQGRVEAISKAFPSLNIVPVDMTGNQGVRKVSVDEAKKWNFQVTDADLGTMFNHLLQQISSGQLDAGSARAAMGNIMQIAGTDAANLSLARQIQQAVKQLTQEQQ